MNKYMKEDLAEAEHTMHPAGYMADLVLWQSGMHPSCFKT